jgi:hypothetical protein
MLTWGAGRTWHWEKGGTAFLSGLQCPLLCVWRGEGEGDGMAPAFPSLATMIETQLIEFTVKVLWGFLDASHYGNSCAGRLVASVWFAWERLSQALT